MKILVVGQGGREHALAWQCARSADVDQVFVAPGNGGTAEEHRCQNTAIAATDIPGLIRFCQQEKIGLTVVGPEVPLALGIKDAFDAAGLRCFAPSQYGAQLESSKAFAKHFMRENNIPTAAYATFDNLTDALNHLERCDFPVVIKADGLAAGKGVVIADNKNVAQQALHAMLADAQFGEASKRVLIEAYLTGPEISFMVMCDGKDYLVLPSSQDHKRRDDGDKGPNTGGMGAFSPSPWLTPALQTDIEQRIIQPTLNAMQQAGHPYTGFLYVGLMLTSDGPYVLEYNCRMGDPETQPILMRLQSDWASHLLAGCEQRIAQENMQWDERVALGVVMASEGYPGEYHTGHVIEGLHQNSDDSKVFHAGTARNTEGNVVTHGGRVLCVTALGATLPQAHARAYAAARKIHWLGCFYRKDIGTTRD